MCSREPRTARVFWLLTLIQLAAAAKKPNILLIFADDLGYNDLDWRDSRLHTPFLRSLAFHKNTVQMNNSYVNQLCTPTRSALMTGYYPFRIGTQSGVFLHMEPTGVPVVFPFVSDNLRALGYSTYLIGKWHLGYCNKKFLPTERGFDYFYGYYGPQTGYFNHSADQMHRESGKLVHGLDLFEEKQQGESKPDFTKGGIYSTDLFSGKAIETLAQHNKDDPFFMFLSFQSVHPPLQVPKSYESHCTAFKPNTLRRVYCGMLAAMDVAIARVVKALKQRGLYDNTIIIFSSDNGGGVDFGASNWPLRGEKDTLWEGGTRTNTFFHSPQFIKNFAVRNEMFHVVDYHATLLGIGGMELNAYGDGINQWPYISTGVPKLRRFQFIYNIDEHGSAIRDGDYKLIFGNTDKHSTDFTGKFRLYRITTDPTESKDISKDNPAIVARMKAKLLSLANFSRKNVRAPLSMFGSPEKFNGTYSSYWCTL
ncbi:sul-3 [Pristionchus pacificus]|uniref:Sul-3 n=1 Tax=Pristionchus pacificus TaxID=54126 RepID=A0A2A6B2A6_PRIPA|nr:sul-3 [Pristionchus pacificus]|eukprot:PDM60023.1 sul-3 [Pristionchus pacificus]